eukprot:Gb_37578 [translate_table: standard]
MQECMLLEGIIRAARILQLDETEWYFVEDDDFGPFSPRNELEALNLVYSIIGDLLQLASDETIELLHALQDTIVYKIDSFSNGDTENTAVAMSSGQAERHLLDWATKHGVRSKLNIAGVA